MTREQMELLLNYIDAKLALLELRQQGNAAHRILHEHSVVARTSKHKLLASLPPTSEN